MGVDLQVSRDVGNLPSLLGKGQHRVDVRDPLREEWHLHLWHELFLSGLNTQQRSCRSLKAANRAHSPASHCLSGLNYPRLTALPLRRLLPLGTGDFINSANKASSG